MLVTVQGQDRQPKESKRMHLGAALMIIAALMDMLDVTIVNVALPTLRTHLHASSAALEWIVSGYMLTFAVALIIAGRLGDRWGRRRLFVIGTIGFGIASLLSGLSHTADQLVVFRLLQGAMAATLLPQVLATFRTVFDGKARATAFGIYGAVAGLASAVGVLLGGVLTEWNIFGLGWRAIFLVNVPIAVIVALLTPLYVTETRAESPGHLDGFGALILAVSLGAIVYPLTEGQQHHWPFGYFLLIAAGILAIGLLGLLEGRRERLGVQPLLQVRQFAIPAFTAGLLVQLLFSLALQGFSIAFILWLQLGHGFSPLRAGTTMLAFSVGAIFTAPNAGKLALQHGRKVLIGGGILMALGFTGIAWVAWHLPAHLTGWALVPGYVVAGAGLGFLVVPLINVVLAAVPAGTSGGASGIFGTAQQLGGALGIAILGSIFFGKLSAHGFDGAFRATLPFVIATLLLCSLLCLFLPNKAVSDEAVIDSQT
ncbi:MAG TPA: MFS transporter [Candidatus Saccharimonadales bacterium]|nr:MFS transporter [Candidatus Saccharimonadales bacterium]